MSTALLLSLVLSSAEFSLEAPSLMKCDGTDFSAGVHPRYAFALAPGKSEYTLKWAVSVKGGAANGTLPRSLQPAGFRVTVKAAGTGAALWASGLVRSTDLTFKLSADTMGDSFSLLTPGKTYQWDLSWFVDAPVALGTTRGGGGGVAASPVGSAKFHLAPSDADWTGTYWIGSNTTNVYKGTFASPGLGGSVMLYVCGLGFSEAYVNGKALSDPVPVLTLTPWSANDFLNSYSTFDVTALLLPAGQENNVTVHLGHGWRFLQKLDPRNNVGDYTHRVLRLLLRADNGSATVDLLKSDAASGKWQTSVSQITADNLYDGATFDSRVEMSWQPVKANIPASEGPLGAMTPWIGPGVHFNREVVPITITEPKKGVFVIDFGVNLAGVVRMNDVAKFAAQIPSGQNITLRHAELLQHADLGSPVQPGMIYTDNLRSAKATDTFIFGGAYPYPTWYPKHTYHGFRYLEVSGWGATPEGIAAGFTVGVGDFTMMHHHTSLKQTVTANFSNAMLNSMQLGAAGSQRSNSQTVQTDCDQRDERLGWLADMGFTSGSMAINYDAQQYFHRLLQNINSNVDPVDGSIPDNTPFVRYGGRPASPTWSLAFPLLAYETWKTYNDTSVVTTYLDGLVRNQENVGMQANKSGVCDLDCSLGDWMPAPTIPGNNFTRLQASGSFVSVVSYTLNTFYIREMAAAVGNASVAASMDAQIAGLKQSLQSCFWHNSSSTFDEDVQANYALAGIIDVLTGGLPQAAAIKTRLADLLALWGGNNYGGIAATRYLFHYLDSVGLAGTAEDVMLKASYPSFGFMATHPLEPLRENMWELMDTFTQGPYMNSRNNLMYTSFSMYLITKMAGLDWRDRKLHAPSLDVSVTRYHGASTVYESHHGNISYAWEYTGGTQRFSLYPTIEKRDTLALFCGSSIAGGGDGGASSVVKSVTKLVLLAQGEPVVSLAELDAACVGKSACGWDVSGYRAFMAARNVTEVRAEVVCSEPLAAVLKVAVPIGVSMSLALPPKHSASSVAEPSLVLQDGYTGEPVVSLAELDAACVGKSACGWDVSGYRAFMAARNVTEVRAEVVCSEPLAAVLKVAVPIGVSMSLALPPKHSASSVAEQSLVLQDGYTREPVVSLAELDAACVGKSACGWDVSGYRAFVAARNVTEVRAEVVCSEPLAAVLKVAVPIGVSMSLALPPKHSASSVAEPSLGEPVVSLAELDAACVGKSACGWDVSGYRAFMAARNVTEVRAEVVCSEPLAAVLKVAVPIGVSMSLALPPKHSASSVAEPSLVLQDGYTVPAGTSIFRLTKHD
ncbi:Beta-galactosidase 15 [Diplonema papillatum]|nr:Beta-galactosidase 15 [Diplonema papillatum]